MNLFLETTTPLGGSNSWIMLVLLGGVFVVMMILPMFTNKKRQKKVQEMQNSIKIGTKVKTIGGFFGEVVGFNEAENTILVDICNDQDQKLIIKLDRQGIYQNVDTTTCPVQGNNEEKKSI